MQAGKGLWRTALSWFTGEYVLETFRQWRGVELAAKAKL